MKSDEEEIFRTQILRKLHQPQRLRLPRPSVLHQTILEESRRNRLHALVLRRMVSKRPRMPLHRRDAEEAKIGSPRCFRPSLFHTKVFIPNFIVKSLCHKARWCSGQTWRPLEPLTRVRISPGLPSPCFTRDFQRMQCEFG